MPEIWAENLANTAHDVSIPPRQSLFLTNAWMDNWWSEWGGDAHAERLGRFYRAHYRLKGLPIRSLQFVGTDHRKLSTPRAEYLALTPGLEKQELDALSELVWTESVFRDLVVNGETERMIRDWAARNGHLQRVIHRDTAYQIDTRIGFEAYLYFLGRNTRLKLYNRRKRLDSMGEVAERFWSIEPFLALLNDFHRERWGAPCFNHSSVRFHTRFLAHVKSEGGVPELSVLTLDGKPVSALYNIVFKGRVYNIQAGFLQELGKGIALGTLHLGYALERAFEAPNIDCFDLLAGKGKNSNYKAHLATHVTPLVSLMVVRHPAFKCLYSLIDRWRNRSAKEDGKSVKTAQ